jgi:K+-transporting ATPase A subunit
MNLLQDAVFVILVIAGLSFLPALALGPIAEHFVHNAIR